MATFLLTGTNKVSEVTGKDDYMGSVNHKARFQILVILLFRKIKEGLFPSSVSTSHHYRRYFLCCLETVRYCNSVLMLPYFFFFKWFQMQLHNRPNKALILWNNLLKSGKFSVNLLPKSAFNILGDIDRNCTLQVL